MRISRPSQGTLTLVHGADLTCAQGPVVAWPSLCRFLSIITVLFQIQINSQVGKKE